MKATTLTQKQKLVKAIYDDSAVKADVKAVLKAIPYGKENQNLLNLLPLSNYIKAEQAAIKRKDDAKKEVNEQLTSEEQLANWLHEKLFNEKVSEIIAENLYWTYTAGMVFLKDAIGTAYGFIASKASTHDFLGYDDDQKLEKVRQVLKSQPLTIQDVAKMFEVKETNLALKKGILQGTLGEIIVRKNAKGENITLETALKAIGKKLQEELETDGLDNNLKALQENDTHWYDMKFVTDNLPQDNEILSAFIASDTCKKIVEWFRAVMQWLTDLLISISSFAKDLINAGVKFTNISNNDVLDKNSQELLSDLRGENPVAWATLSQVAKKVEVEVLIN